MTKAQRHKVYKKCLAAFKKDKIFGRCICLMLLRVSDIAFEIYKVLEVFPELKKKKPKAIKDKYDPWWNYDKAGYESRIAALKQCIKETAPKKQTA